MDLDEGRVVFGAHRSAEEVEIATDPVCRMEVNKFETHARMIHEGAPYFFCSEDCKARFEAEPGSYVQKAR